MQRITPEMVLEAYQKTGLSPRQGKYFSNNYTCACGLGVMAAVHGHKPMNNDVRTPRETLREFGVSDEYHDGFFYGFDNIDSSASFNDEEKQGYKDGIAAWEAVKHLVIDKEGESA